MESEGSLTSTVIPSGEITDTIVLTQEQLRELQVQYLRNFLPHVPPAPLQSQIYSIGSFTQGLLVGQVSVILCLVVFIKFFIFSDAPSSPSTSNTLPIINKKFKNKTFINSQGSAENSEQSTLISTILEKTYYDVETHQPESLDWFNVLIAQTISQFREEALNNDNIYHSLTESLSKMPLPDYLDTIKVTEIDIGHDFPIFSNCRIQSSEENGGRLEAKIDVDLSDTLTLGLETRLLLNHPKPLTAALPVALTVSIVRFSGCLTVSLISTSEDLIQGTTKAAVDGDSALEEEEDKFSKGTALMFSFSPDYRLEFEIKSLIGSRSKLQDIPKIGNLIELKLKEWFMERCIEPRFQVITLPSMWPRKKNTREPVARSDLDAHSVEEENF